MEDWEKRRKQLDKMFAEDVQIFEVYNGVNQGIVLFNKSEFINKITMPSRTLNEIRILETEYRVGKIINLRFTTKIDTYTN